MQPSIKGIVMQFVTSPIERFVEAGRVSWEDLEVRLEKRDLEIFEEKIIPGLWYPIDSFGRLLDVSCELSGMREKGQWAEIGFQTASSFLNTPVFDEMVRSACALGTRAGPALVRLSHLLLSFSEWEFHNESEDGHHFRIEVADARALPDGVIRVAQGLIEYLTTRVYGTRLRVTASRPTATTALFRGAPAVD